MPPQLTMSPEEHGRDLETALKLLLGFPRWDKAWFGYPSSNTSPTEKEARAALSRILLSGNVPRELLSALADLFSPDPKDRLGRKVIFKNLSKRHSKVIVDFQIALKVEILRREVHSYERAAEAVADKFGLDRRHIKKIYGKFKDILATLRPDLPR